MKAGVNYIIGDPAPPDPNIYKVQITYAAPPATTEVEYAPLKYNKNGWIAVQWDHSLVGVNQALPILNAATYTDGCGNSKNYRGSVGVNGRNQADNAEIGYLPDEITYELMATLLGSKWTIENHGFYHDPEGNYNNGTDEVKNTNDLDDLIFLRTGYRMNTTIVPTNYAGYPNAAAALGYVSSESTGTFDDFPPEPPFTILGTYSNLQYPFAAIRRDFSDELVTEIADKKTNVNNVINGSGRFYVLGSHESSPAFQELIDHIEDNAADSVLVVSAREALEYISMKQCPKAVELTGSTLTITIDTSAVSSRVQWRDLSLLAPAGMTGVTVEGADSVSYNPTTGLINILKEKTIWL